MPPSKRKPRRKAAEMQETSELDLLDSSPSRPSVKKRKVNGGRANLPRRNVSLDPTPATNSDGSGDESEIVSDSDLIDSVILYLTVSKEPVMASAEYSNEKNQNDNMEKVSAYAKIAGRDWTYFVVDQSVNIGRSPDTNKDNGPFDAVASSPIADMKEMLPVHIDLGPSKIVSRHHASIFYDSEYPEGGGWHVRVNGRNGVKVNLNLLKRGACHQLKSGDIVDIAGTQMMFVTPGDKAVIDPYFVERAKRMATGEELNITQHAHPASSQRSSLPSGSRLFSSQQPLAPAPPASKQALTPPGSQRDGSHQSVFDSKPPVSPIYNRGMLMESTQEIDYSKDAAKDLKPPFSYATMIAQAIFSSEEEKLTLNSIYQWISEKYAFYRHSNSGWQNSIRHNLSLNKAFQKVPRRTDEPGKGMKWQIAPEFREEYWKKQARRGMPTSSSVPTSPAGGTGKNVNPNFRGPNGQNLGYDTSMVGQFPARDFAPIPPLPPHPAARNATNLFISSQSAPTAPGATTPHRPQRADMATTISDHDFDDSPLPRHHQGLNPTPGKQPTYALPSSVPHPQHSPTNPTLSSSYLDSPFHSAHNSIITPAPLRQNPRLAPPSTLVAPSKFMPESSPAGPGLFWKGFLSGNTPAHKLTDLSPVKGDADDGRGVLSSSPPPMDPAASPSKPARSSSVRLPPSSTTKDEINFQNGKANGMHNAGLTTTKDENGDEDGSMGGFDLARGFQPIGSFHSHGNQGHGPLGNSTTNAARASS